MSEEYEDDNIHDIAAEEHINEEEYEESDSYENEEEAEAIEEEHSEEESGESNEETNQADESDEHLADNSPPRTLIKDLKESKREQLRAKAEVEQLKAELQRQQAFAQQIWEENQRTIQEKEYQRQYAESLNSRVHDTSQAYMQQHDEMLNIRLTQAEKMKREAIESGNVDAMMEADRNFNAVMFDIGEHQRWKAKEDVRKKHEEEEAYKQQFFQQQQAQQHQMLQQHQYEQQVAYQHEVNDLHNWLSTNQWADPRSEEYDPEFVDVMDQFADNYEHQLRNSGYGHLVGTPQFKQKISEIAYQYRNGKQTQRGNLNMRTPRYPVNTSRGSGGRMSMREPSRNHSQLGYTKEERDMVDRLRAHGHPVSKERFLVSKDLDMRTNADGRRTGRSHLKLTSGR